MVYCGGSLKGIQFKSVLVLKVSLPHTVQRGDRPRKRMDGILQFLVRSLPNLQQVNMNCVHASEWAVPAIAESAPKLHTVK